MDSPSSSTAGSAVPPPQGAEAETKLEKEMVYPTKVIQFLGRETPIILQSENGPCPLLAICNVLSLKNNLNLTPDISEVSQGKLLSLVAERLIDSNSNIDGKDADYVENQQQNIADVIDLLPRLTTGIDVNIRFRRNDDFEFTPECAIFDLLDIPLYHGWIVDPQDNETVDAIGSKSYNTVMEELVSLETQTIGSERKSDPEDDVDFAAATTAALGVPSPSLSRGPSFNDSPLKARKGDIEEETELLRVLKLSGAEIPRSVADVNPVESPCIDKSELVAHSGQSVENNGAEETVKAGTSNSDDSNALRNHIVNSSSETVQCTFKKSMESCETAVDNIGCGPETENQISQPLSLGELSQSASNAFQGESTTSEHVQKEFTSTPSLDEPRNSSNDCESREPCSLVSVGVEMDSSSGQLHNVNKFDAFTSSADDSEPIYEGEECIMESQTVVYDTHEPIYEGEVVLSEQIDGGCIRENEFKNLIYAEQAELVRCFLKNSASQLTIYGLFCLQDKVKERELCVFFRNNHFNTMFKYEGELYILATDHGFINQPDLVWEKLNEVNGDTLYMTGNFKEFQMDDQSNGAWDEQNAIASTTDYLASMDGVAPSDPSFNSDLQLAMALQQQEFEQQQQQSPSTDPQVPSSSEEDQPKLRDRCIVM